MTMKIVFVLVTVAAFVSAISGRTMAVHESGADMEAAFFRPHFRPYPGFFGGYRGGAGGFRGGFAGGDGSSGSGTGGIGSSKRDGSSHGGDGGDDIGAPGDLAQGASLP
ncbi:glycine-rich protein DOT1-like [Salvia divinorum]|uniref:Glycine-rich protein DOT1-like n=1 Tax=Salvia divinorum TaxID=28513 RepID=A0ABD1HV26_SALDI